MNADTAAQALEAVRAKSPLVHNITNYVVMTPTANALLALGAAPVMAHAEDEAADMAALASSLVINIGTLSAPWVRAMRSAMQSAAAHARPIVFDPVGAGATRYRTETAASLLDGVPVAIIRGNASEIRTLGGQSGETRGVDSRHASDEALEAARALALRRQTVVSVSGAVDLITDGRRGLRVHHGHPLMARVTGMGCSASALTGAFAAVLPSPFEAAGAAMGVMGLAGEQAAGRARGPGSFFPEFLDALAALTADDIRAGWHVETME